MDHGAGAGAYDRVGLGEVDGEHGVGVPVGYGVGSALEGAGVGLGGGMGGSGGAAGGWCMYMAWRREVLLERLAVLWCSSFLIFLSENSYEGPF